MKDNSEPITMLACITDAILEVCGGVQEREIMQVAKHD